MEKAGNKIATFKPKHSPLLRRCLLKYIFSFNVFRPKNTLDQDDNVNHVKMVYTSHTNTHAYRGFSGDLTFGLLPSMFSCISCATVFSRILFSSACCRRSFISSRVSSSGCKGGREGYTATMKPGHTAGGVGEERRKHTRTGDLDVSGSQ